MLKQLMDDKTGAQLDAHEVRTYLEFAGERAYISKDEMVSGGGVDGDLLKGGCGWCGVVQFCCGAGVMLVRVDGGVFVCLGIFRSFLVCVLSCTAGALLFIDQQHSFPALCGSFCVGSTANVW